MRRWDEAERRGDGDPGGVRPDRQLPSDERRSLILTSNLHPGSFDTIFPKSLATAAIDRLLHHAHLVVTEGQSKRLADALDGKGVSPLSEPMADSARAAIREP